MFVLVVGHNGEQREVSPEMANALVEERLLFSCHNCGHCVYHPSTDVEWPEIEAKLNALLN